jgi:hypothetical protein
MKKRPGQSLIHHNPPMRRWLCVLLGIGFVSLILYSLVIRGSGDVAGASASVNLSRKLGSDDAGK